MTLITDRIEAAEFCERLSGADYLTVDTEFLREKTYWPRLCLVQIGGENEAAAIDPLAEGMDLQPVFDLLSNPRIRKVFHAARQDLEIFHHLTGRLPTPVFDTQVAAMVCGFGDSVGYETLVAKLTGARIDKSSRFTDWSLRPLSDRQIHYALADVTHLRKVYEKLRAKLERNSREGWLDEEMATLTATATYENDPRESFRRIKGKGANPKYLAILREVAAWRENESKTRDLPRNHVLRDEALTEIAHHAPTTVAALSRVRGLSRKFAEGNGGAALLKAIADGLAVPEDQRPHPENRAELPRGIGPMTELLKVLLKMQCEEADVAQKMVATTSDLEQIAADGEKADVLALKGWRRKVFGESAIRLCKGETALAASGRKVKLIPVEPSATK